jgi:spoIIIJ-associated protein
MQDKVAAAKKIDEFLKLLNAQGGFRLKYRITVDPPAADGDDWERPEIFVELGGPESSLLLDRGAELMRSIESLALEALRLKPDEHNKVLFDCRGYRATRLQELRLAADVAAEKVRTTKVPYQFAPMSSRERRIVHLSLSKQTDLRTESQGEGPARCLVVFPAGYESKEFRPVMVPARRGRR